jgi:hypothetical protein
MTALYVRCPACGKALTQFNIDHERCVCGVKLATLEDDDAETAVAKARSSEVPENPRAGIRELAAKVAVYEAERLLTPEQAEKLRELLKAYGRDLLERCEAELGRVQWGAPAEGNLCPSCSGTTVHADDCALAALLADLRKELGN